jgi:hypothetical protein
MMRKLPSGYVVLSDDRENLLQTPRASKIVRYMERGKHAILPLAFLTWLVVGAAAGNYGLVLSITVPVSLFVLAVAEFVCRTADLAVSRIILPTHLRGHEAAGLLVQLPKGLVKLARNMRIRDLSMLFDRDHKATRQLVELYRQHGDSPQVRERIQALSAPTD